ncbi:MAG: FAD synthetase family protein [Clostridia bacterium]|nr:FAD synthetase family protein [Clostridia bacterium]
MSVCVLGFFDGVHAAHRALLKRAVRAARARGEKSIAVTFSESPESLLAQKEPMLLCTFSEKEQRIRLCGIDELYLLDERHLRMSGEEFAAEILRGTLDAKVVFCGENYRFGRHAACTPRQLRDFGEKYGFKTVVMPLLKRDNESISSTRIRNLIANGETVKAKKLM